MSVLSEAVSQRRYCVWHALVEVAVIESLVRWRWTAPRWMRVRVGNAVSQTVVTLLENISVG